jgi:sulfur-carrier protein
VKVKIPAQMRTFAGGQAVVTVDEAGTVQELLDKIGQAHPELSARLLDDNGEIRRFVNIYVGDEDVRFLDGLNTSLDARSQVSILPAVAGG